MEISEHEGPEVCGVCFHEVPELINQRKRIKELEEDAIMRVGIAKELKRRCDVKNADPIAAEQKRIQEDLNPIFDAFCRQHDLSVSQFAKGWLSIIEAIHERKNYE